jgi:hypothetical protein
MSAGSKTALSLGTLELGMILPSSAAGFPSKDDMSFRRAAVVVVVVVVGSQLELWTCDGGGFGYPKCTQSSSYKRICPRNDAGIQNSLAIHLIASIPFDSFVCARLLEVVACLSFGGSCRG